MHAAVLRLQHACRILHVDRGYQTYGRDYRDADNERSLRSPGIPGDFAVFRGHISGTGWYALGCSGTVSNAHQWHRIDCTFHARPRPIAPVTVHAPRAQFVNQRDNAHTGAPRPTRFQERAVGCAGEVRYMVGSRRRLVQVRGDDRAYRNLSVH